VLFLFTLPDARAYISRALDSKTWVASAPFWAGPALPFMYAIAQYHECIGGVKFLVGKDVRCGSFKVENWVGRGLWGKGVVGDLFGVDLGDFPGNCED